MTPKQKEKSIIGEFIRDITSVASFPMAKSEVRRRLNEILSQQIKKAQIEILDEVIEKLPKKNKFSEWVNREEELVNSGFTQAIKKVRDYLEALKEKLKDEL